MAIDYWTLAKDFSAGDMVQRVLPGQGVTPYAGRVQAVLRGIGFVDVQWPFGAERVSPEELLRVHPQFGTFLPPALDFSYFPGLDAKQASADTPWRLAHELPVGFHKELARSFHKGANEIQAYDEIWHRFASATDDESIKDEISTFYRFANNAWELLIQQHAAKSAAYWASRDRKYRATRGEMNTRRPNCPRCGTAMRKATYKMREGQRERLFACPNDLYLIKQDDVVGPTGESVGW